MYRMQTATRKAVVGKIKCNDECKRQLGACDKTVQTANYIYVIKGNSGR